MHIQTVRGDFIKFLFQLEMLDIKKSETGSVFEHNINGLFHNTFEFKVLE